MGSIERRRASVERPSPRTASRWLGTISRVRANQNAERPVSTRPLSGISVGSTTSKVEIRSLATRTRRSSSSSKISRTLPLARWTASSDMDFLLVSRSQSRQPPENDRDVSERGREVERLRQRLAIESGSDLVVAGDDLVEVAPLVGRADGVALNDAVRLVAPDACVHE